MAELVIGSSDDIDSFITHQGKVRSLTLAFYKDIVSDKRFDLLTQVLREKFLVDLQKLSILINGYFFDISGGVPGQSTMSRIHDIFSAFEKHFDKIEVLEVMDQPRKIYRVFDFGASNIFQKYLIKFNRLTELHLGEFSFAPVSFIFLSRAIDAVSSLSTLTLIKISNIRVSPFSDPAVSSSWTSLLTNSFSKCSNVISISFVLKDPWPLTNDSVLFSLSRLLLLSKSNLALTLEELPEIRRGENTGVAIRFLLGALDKGYHADRKHHTIHQFFFTGNSRSRACYSFATYFNITQNRFLEDHLSFDIRKIKPTITKFPEF